MSDAWLRVVLDDAPPEQRLGAITISELRAQQIEGLTEALPDQIIEMLDGFKVTHEQARQIVAKIVSVSLTIIETNTEKIKLRLQGQEPVH